MREPSGSAVCHAFAAIQDPLFRRGHRGPRKHATEHHAVEQCWVLVGQRRNGIWLARRIREQTGEPAQVAFDGPWVLQREERRGDVLGFYHTHPGMTARPSRRDVRTMRAWCSAFAKPLVCVIAGADATRGFLFADDETRGVELKAVAMFPRGVIVGVEADGG